MSLKPKVKLVRVVTEVTTEMFNEYREVEEILEVSRVETWEKGDFQHVTVIKTTVHP